MSVGSVGSSNAYSYLQSLLQQQPTASADKGGAPPDPLTSLLQAFYPSGSGDAASGGSAGTPAGATSPQLSPDTLGALISAQGQQGQGGCVAARTQSVFNEFDTNADGGISKSEFEGVFGSNADKSKVDGLFNALDANGGGSIDPDEMTSAARASRAHHRHHAHGMGQGQGAGGGPAGLLSSIDATGATTQTASNTDGSNTTTITYADGSSVSMTLPSASANGGTAANTAGGNKADVNLLEKLIAWQSQLLAPASAGTLTVA
jgi:hypothetical protein